MCMKNSAFIITVMILLKMSYWKVYSIYANLKRGPFKVPNIRCN